MTYVQFPTADGAFITLETEDSPVGTGPTPASRSGGSVIKHVQSTFEEALGPIKRTAAILFREMRESFPTAPDELEIEFSVKASLEASALVLAKAAGEGSFTVKAVWNSPPAASA